MANLLNISQASDMLGVSRAAITKAIKANRLPTAAVRGEDGNWKINADTVVAEWKKNSSVSKMVAKGSPLAGAAPVPLPRATPARPAATESGEDLPPPPAAGGTEPDDGGAGGAYNRARAIRESFAARTARLEWEKASGKVIDVNVVRVNAFKAARVARNSLNNLPDRIASIVAAEADPKKCHEIIQTEVDLILNELAKQFEALSKKQEDDGGASNS